MNTQPEALQLADALSAYCTPQDVSEQAAAELRRLHEAHDWQYRMAGERLRRVVRLEAERDELKRHLAYWLPDETMIPEGHQAAWRLAVAAIAKVEDK